MFLIILGLIKRNMNSPPWYVRMHLSLCILRQIFCKNICCFSFYSKRFELSKDLSYEFDFERVEDKEYNFDCVCKVLNISNLGYEIVPIKRLPVVESTTTQLLFIANL